MIQKDGLNFVISKLEQVTNMICLEQ